VRDGGANGKINENKGETPPCVTETIGRQLAERDFPLSHGVLYDDMISFPALMSPGAEREPFPFLIINASVVCCYSHVRTSSVY
jgi:hypothetical protein